MESGRARFHLPPTSEAAPPPPAGGRSHRGRLPEAVGPWRRAGSAMGRERDTPCGVQLTSRRCNGEGQGREGTSERARESGPSDQRRTPEWPSVKCWVDRDWQRRFRAGVGKGTRGEIPALPLPGLRGTLTSRAPHAPGSRRPKKISRTAPIQAKARQKRHQASQPMQALLLYLCRAPTSTRPSQAKPVDQCVAFSLWHPAHTGALAAAAAAAPALVVTHSALPAAKRGGSLAVTCPDPGGY